MLGCSPEHSAYLGQLEQSVRSMTNPWETANGLRVLGEVNARWGFLPLALDYLEAARQMARQFGYAEILWQSEQTIAIYFGDQLREIQGPAESVGNWGTKALGDESHELIEQLVSMRV